MRDEDDVQHILAANTMDSLLVFTNRGKVYQLKVHELPDAGRTAKGLPIVNLINMQPDETVTTLMKVRDYAPASTSSSRPDWAGSSAPRSTSSSRFARPV